MKVRNSPNIYCARILTGVFLACLFGFLTDLLRQFRHWLTSLKADVPSIVISITVEPSEKCSSLVFLLVLTAPLIFKLFFYGRLAFDLQRGRSRVFVRQRLEGFSFNILYDAIDAVSCEWFGICRLISLLSSASGALRRSWQRCLQSTVCFSCWSKRRVRALSLFGG